MRIVHLVIGGDVAGGQTIALRLARAAQRRGDDVAFVAPEPGPFVDLVRAEGTPVHLLPLRRLHQLDKTFRLARLLRAARAGVLHTHTLAAANVLGRAAARLAGVPVISHLHIENHFRPATRPLLRLLDNASARFCAHLVAVSEDTRRAYERQGYPRGRIQVVYNGVELDGRAPVADIRSELGIPEGAPLVGEVARLCDVKGQRELIGAVASVPEAWLVLVGVDLERGGAFQAELERDADRLGVRDRVVFAGRRADAADLIGQLDVVALPSWTEGLPLVLLEAMARRRAVVATPVGGTPELVLDGETGVLVPARDPEALAVAIQRLLADPGLRERLGDAGHRRVAERFSADAMCQRVLELYDEVAAR
jgi:glycosyltransferase involved in cell wall biosynthesis